MLTRSFDDIERILTSLRRAVELLASAKDTQLQWMNSTGNASEDMMIGLDGSLYTQIPILRENGALGQRFETRTRELLNFMSSWSDIALWQSDDALDREEWTHARQLAGELLQFLDADSAQFRRRYKLEKSCKNAN